LIITIVGIALFVGLGAGCRILYDQTEDRLLGQRTSEAALAIQLSVSQIQAPLDAAAKLAMITNGDPASFRTMIGSSVGDGKSFTSAALYRVGEAEPIAVVGPALGLAAADGANGTPQMLDRATHRPFIVVDLMSGTPRRLGYAVADSTSNAKYVAYGERVLSVDPNVRRRTDQPFSNLDYAFYLGDHVAADKLLGSSLRNLPITGRHDQQAIDFGDTKLLVVMTPIGRLSSDLFANLWWIVAGTGVLVSGAFGVLAHRLLERRNTAMALATDNARLYDEQRQIAETLQLSLLPEELVTPEGVDATARYWPAGSASLIGGDFYDLFVADDQRWAVAIGDVCGKGIEAASLTGLARHTLRAAARQGNSPDAVLMALHHALSDHRPATFCTACFGYVSALDNGSYCIDLCLGGHPEPIVRHADGSVEFIGRRGTLLGMIEPTLAVSSTELHPGDTLVFYTDGLTDAPPSEAVTVEELADLLRVRGDDPIDRLADSIRALKRQRRPRGSGDDTVVLILRFGADTSAGDRLASDIDSEAAGDRVAS
jgi:serine phosphatase RsbU (regulator of sigma subunit)